jgi:hypothetical protein
LPRFDGGEMGLGSPDGAQWLMNQGRAVFSQLISFLPDREFRRCVERYQGDSRLRGFSCWDQYLSMAFAQLTYRESLRDIEACLHSVEGKLYHLGFRGKVARSTLADANESHDWRIFADFAQVLIRIARPLYAHDEIGVDLDQSLYALDSTTIDLCLSLFPWPKFRQRKWIKQHLRIKAFYGTSENAVKTQIWIAVSIYVLVAIVRKRLGLAASLYQTLQILSVTLFEKTPILCALQASDAAAEFAENVNQLILFDI